MRYHGVYSIKIKNKQCSVIPRKYGHHLYMKIFSTNSQLKFVKLLDKKYFLSSI